MTDTWQAISNIANVAGLTSFVITGASGVVKGYQTYASSYTSLAESERVLERIRSRLQGLSQQRRDEIEIVIRSKATNCKSLNDIEIQLQECVLLIYTLFRTQIHDGIH